MFNRALSIFAIMMISSLSLMSQTVDEIIEKSIEAAGGKAVFENMKSSYMLMSMQVMGMEMKMKMYFQEPKVRIEQEGMGQNMVVVFDGEKGWMKNQGMVEEIPQEQIEEMKSQSSANAASLWHIRKQEGINIEKVGKTKVDGVSAYNLKITDKEGKVSNVYLDASTYHMVKMKMSSEAGEMEMFFSELKTFNGYTMPTKYTVNVQGMKVESNIVEFEMNPKLDNSLFDKPNTD